MKWHALFTTTGKGTPTASAVQHWLRPLVRRQVAAHLTAAAIALLSSEAGQDPNESGNDYKTRKGERAPAGGSVRKKSRRR